MRALVLALVLGLAAGCGSSSPQARLDAGPGLDAALATDAAPEAAPLDAAPATDGAPSDSGGDAAPSCPRTPAAADRTRYVVVSHPYDVAGDPASTYQLLTLTSAGALAATDTTFQMGRAVSGEIVFTPDGKVGIAVQDDDGTLGVFTVDDAGAVTVKHTGFGSGIFYASKVVIDATGEHAWVVDGDWRNNGGGIYRVRIGCDGTLASEGLYTASKLATELLLLPGTAPTRAILVAYDVLSSAPPTDTHLLVLDDPAALVTSVDAFPAVGGSETEIVASAALTIDGRYALIGDNTEFDPPTRVAVVEVTTGGLVAHPVLSPIGDPVAIVASPFGSPILVVDGYGNAIHQLTYDPANTTTPFVVAADLTYSGAAPQLPDKAVMVGRGQLEGRVLIAENVGVRQVAFHSDGTAVDLGMTPAGGTDDGTIVGAIGVQP